MAFFSAKLFGESALYVAKALVRTSIGNWERMGAGLAVSYSPSSSASYSPSSYGVRRLGTTCPTCRDDRRTWIRSAPKRDEGAQGEGSVDIDGRVATRDLMFPDEHTPNLVFDGIKFSDLPICHIKVSKNNTILQVTDKGNPVLLRSCGIEGFKNTKKGTNIAAQATAVSLGIKAIDRGMKTLRVKVQGLGPGRMSSLKGLQMAGVNIVSITDVTPIPRNGPRPRKQRRV